MSAIFQRPLCDMGAAYDYSFRPTVGDPEAGSGGGCDERPHRVELFSATTDPGATLAEWRPFGLCTEHESQLQGYDRRLVGQGRPSRFRARPASGPGRA
ncbi:MAG: hypothetical protein L3K10_01940 [Thermoplasmata archaeon]|nr:hypothetical protein [Thermoplasmata archaeon]